MISVCPVIFAGICGLVYLTMAVLNPGWVGTYPLLTFFKGHIILPLVMMDSKPFLFRKKLINDKLNGNNLISKEMSRDVNEAANISRNSAVNNNRNKQNASFVILNAYLKLG